MITMPQSGSPRRDLLQKLSLVRPRFLYLWVRVAEIPVPIFLFAPLVMLEFFLAIAARAVGRSSGRDPQLTYALQALRAFQGQTWELRRMPPFVLVEVDVAPKAFDPRAPSKVYVKIGLW